ncbi:hypothetical protein Ahy_A06g029456 [Arachis hypogaea]|uniref:Uncharacterized protein n=1 Tax=Arachis hypogaea TaxID=3818 RepID=A0A445CTC7_ARAHY|nr:hypothetical protein Ahy_A06g029456 [Arachis hypogaea]
MQLSLLKTLTIRRGSWNYFIKIWEITSKTSGVYIRYTERIPCVYSCAVLVRASKRPDEFCRKNDADEEPSESKKQKTKLKRIHKKSSWHYYSEAEEASAIAAVEATAVDDEEGQANNSALVDAINGGKATPVPQSHIEIQLDLVNLSCQKRMTLNIFTILNDIDFIK